jgi:PAS domain S-box-containing protein
VNDSDSRLERLLIALVQNAPLPIYVKDEDCRFVLSNAEHRRLLERDESEILGRTDAYLLGEDASEVEHDTRRVLDQSKSVAEEYALPIGGEQRTYLETIFPLRAADGRVMGVGGIATDITTRRALERALADRNSELESTLEALRNTQAELVENERLAALGPLVAAVAHEVNTPLGVALTASTHLRGVVTRLDEAVTNRTLSQSQLEDSVAEVKRSVTLAVRSIERATELMKSFKQVAIDQSHPSLRATSLAEWLVDIESSLGALCGRTRVALDVELEGDRRLAIAVGELQQVVTNLVINAVTHGFPEGFEGSQPPRIQLRLVGEPDALRIEVRDNGRGMEAEVLQRSVEPFFTTRRREGGSGLGLHIVQTLVTERFEGHLAIESEPGRGTLVVATLPIGTAAIVEGSKE